MIFIFVIVYLFTALVGSLLEKVKVPWIFASLILGFVLAGSNPFSEVMSSEAFILVTNIGMWFLLFIIGFEINLKEIQTQKGFIVKTTFFLVFLEAMVGSIFVHFVFGTQWLIAIIVAISFATVGEIVLLPILEEFNLVRTRLGQIILGAAIVDDVFEVAVIFATILLTGVGGDGGFNVVSGIGSLALLFMLTIVLLKSGKLNEKLMFPDGEFAFLLSILVLFLFIAVGQFAFSEASSLGALFSGIAMGNFLSKEGKNRTRLAVRSIGFALFGPMFLVSVGAKVSIAYLLMFPYLIFAKVALTKGIKTIGSFLIGRNKIGITKSLILGSCLSVKFSTSIIVFTILFNKELIGIQLYSVLISSKIVYKFVIPFVLRSLVPKATLIKIE